MSTLYQMRHEEPADRPCATGDENLHGDCTSRGPMTNARIAGARKALGVTGKVLVKIVSVFILPPFSVSTDLRIRITFNRLSSVSRHGTDFASNREPRASRGSSLAMSSSIAQKHLSGGSDHAHTAGCVQFGGSRGAVRLLGRRRACRDHPILRDPGLVQRDTTRAESRRLRRGRYSRSCDE